MPRATNAPASKARTKRILKQAKGFYGRRKNVYTVAKNAVEKALCYAYRDRRQRRRDFRSLWIQRINAGARLHNLNYSTLIKRLKEQEIAINRKVLADLAMNHPQMFNSIVKAAL